MEILSWLDDHSRKALLVTVHERVTGRIVVGCFRESVAIYGIPALTLTDNGMVYPRDRPARIASLRTSDRSR